tara:strand:- start:253 stop:441 length:189 start_codon:yes stop_codon:yes gene_type:complete
MSVECDLFETFSSAQCNIGCRPAFNGERCLQVVGEQRLKREGECGKECDLPMGMSSEHHRKQ